MVTLTWKRHQGSWIKVVKRKVWILNWVVSGTFADLDQDPDLHYPLVRNKLAKAQRSIVPARARAEAAAEAQAKAFPGEI